MQNKITVQQLQEKILEFNKKRGWLNLPPQDLAKSIIIEAAELLELYQWDNLEREGILHSTDKKKEEIESEVADVFIYLLNFCRETNINLLSAAEKKLKINEKRVPVKQQT
mgnify:CR=1 FL=1